MQVNSSLAFVGVREWQDEFLALFPHRFDYIWANHPNSIEPVEWRTESRHPLSDRLIQQGAYLYGVRFAAETQYCLLDIDIESQYHPQQDPFAISRMLSALETLGCVSYVACTSSYSDGLHLYFPFQQAQNSWKLAIAVSTLLENAGFKLKPGQLEVFPDPKPYTVTGKPSLFNAHRLPLQTGSYLLNCDFQPIWTTQQNFVQQWQLAQAQNDVESTIISSILKQIKRQRYGISTRAEKFINDLNTEIELGWTGYGQTNYLLGRITMREYVFRHVLSGGNPLTGETLVQAIVDVARSLPGYTEYCRHRHEIEHRAMEWARCIEQSHYFHYGDAAGKFKSKLAASPSTSAMSNADLAAAIATAPTWNQQQTESARDRIQRAIADLLEKENLPANATARFQALVCYGIGGGTLYKHRDLWHPYHLTMDFDGSVQPHDNPPHPPTSNQDAAWDCCEAASQAANLTSLFPHPGRNRSPDEDCSDLENSTDGSGRNVVLPNELVAGEPKGDRSIHPVLLDIKAIQQARHAALQQAQAQHQVLKQEAAQARQIARMQQFLDSNDPILVAEAIAWSQVNPGLLQLERDNVESAQFG